MRLRRPGPGPTDRAPPTEPGDTASPRARRLAGIALSMSWLGTALLVASVVLRGLAVMRPPWGNMFEFAIAGCAAAALAYCALARRNRWEWLGIFVIGPVLLTLGLALFAFYTEAAELMPALQERVARHPRHRRHPRRRRLHHRVLGRHRLPASSAAARRTRAERKNFLETLPSAAALERTAYALNMVGFILWTFTLIAGAIWAQKAWSAYWTWDPKEVWTFVIWVVYAAYMHARATAGWEPRRAMVSRWSATSACCSTSPSSTCSSRGCTATRA